MCKSVLLLWAPGMEWEGNLEFRVLSGLHFTNATCCVSLGKMVHLSGPPFFPFHIRAPPDCYSENQMLKRGEARQLFIHWTYKSFPSHCTLGSQHHFCCCNKYLPKSNLGEKKGFICLTIPGHSPLLWRSRGRNVKHRVHIQEWRDNKHMDLPACISLAFSTITHA